MVKFSISFTLGKAGSPHGANIAHNNNRFYLKPTEAGRSLLRSVEMRSPYDGAKVYFFIEDVDDRDYIAELVRATCKELPLAKPKRK